MVGVGLALVVGASLAFAAIPLGPMLGYVDQPDDSHLKAHTRPAVPLGGVAIFVAVHVGWATAGVFEWGVLLASALLLVLGLVDDRIGLSPITRLGVEIVAGLALGAEVARDRGWLIGGLVAGFVVVAVNAVNLFDGLDGLAGSAALVSACAGALVAVVYGGGYLPGLVLAAALFGFLLANWHPAKVFLGDNGSYSVALFLVWVLVSATTDGERSGLIPVLVGMSLLGVFLIDLASTVLRRFRSGHPLFAGDRTHVYDRLHARGLSVPMVAVIVGLTQVVVTGVPVLLAALTTPIWAAAGAFIVGGALVVALGLGHWLPPAPHQPN